MRVKCLNKLSMKNGDFQLVIFTERKHLAIKNAWRELENDSLQLPSGSFFVSIICGWIEQSVSHILLIMKEVFVVRYMKSVDTGIVKTMSEVSKEAIRFYTKEFKDDKGLQKDFGSRV